MVDPVTGALAGLSAVNAGYEVLKKSINNVSEVSDLMGHINQMMTGEQQIQKERYSDKSLIGQHKDAAHTIIDGKLAAEKLHEVSVLIDNRFGPGTWRSIVNLRAKQIQEEKEREKQKRIAERKRKQEMKEAAILVAGVTAAVSVVIVILMAIFLGPY